MEKSVLCQTNQPIRLTFTRKNRTLVFISNKHVKKHSYDHHIILYFRDRDRVEHSLTCQKIKGGSHWTDSSYSADSAICLNSEKFQHKPNYPFRSSQIILNRLYLNLKALPISLGKIQEGERCFFCKVEEK